MLLLKISEFRRHSFKKQFFQKLFQWNAVLLDLILPKYSDFKTLFYKNTVILDVISKKVIIGVIPQK